MFFSLPRRTRLSNTAILCPASRRCKATWEPMKPHPPVTKIVLIPNGCPSGASRCDDARAESHPKSETKRERGDHKRPSSPGHTKRDDSGACRRASTDEWRYPTCETCDDLRAARSSPALLRLPKRPFLLRDDTHSRDSDARRERRPRRQSAGRRNSAHTRAASCPNPAGRSQTLGFVCGKGPCERQNNQSTARAAGDSFG